MEKEARDAWKKCFVYIWGTAENAGWPGVEAELTDHGLYRYVLPYQYEMDGSLGNVIFNSGSGQQFDAGQIRPGQQMVYTLDGKLVKELTTQHAGTFRLNLSTLPQGVYIVKADTLTYKLLKR